MTRARTVLALSTAIAAGVVISVAVAWVSSQGPLRIHGPGDEAAALAQFDRWRARHWPERFPPADSVRVLGSGSGRTTTMHDADAVIQFGPEHELMAARVRVATHAYGWPARCLETRSWAVTRYPRPHGRPVIEEGHDGGFELTVGPPAWSEKLLPTRIRWRGMLANATIWGAPVAAVLLCPGLVRHQLRRRRGACLRCGYQLTGGGPCPECGRAA